MKVKVKSFANIKEVLGSGEIELNLKEGSTIGDLLEELIQRYGEPFERQVIDKAKKTFVPFLLLVNGKTYRSLTDRDKLLSDGQTVTILIPFDGG